MILLCRGASDILDFIVDPRFYDTPNKCSNASCFLPKKGDSSKFTVTNKYSGKTFAHNTDSDKLVSCLIDGESELRGLTRKTSNCPSKHYKPTKNNNKCLFPQPELCYSNHYCSGISRNIPCYKPPVC